ncbi:MAG: maltose alpha-D-glucosyltransferase [Trueperaceae bacterium]|nr:maltose alpha-D-glucosyltransferase [Trueperaceae bacterium]
MAAPTASQQWYKDAVIYQIHVRSFFDSNNDGYGDFTGVREKLPYLEELGVNTLWLLPFYKSPLRDDGYDISDYYQILPVHGDLDAFQAFLQDAKSRGMRVITELVLNHTSDQHQWFQEARDPASPKHDWYVWSESAEKYKDVRIIFTDTEHSNWAWDPKAKKYYWHRFFSHQPDLNWDNPEVEKAMHEVMFYWLDMGVDGFRLDAVPYLYEREGTNSENLPETLDAIKRLRKALDERYNGEKILLAEANQWPEDTLPYFGDSEGDGVQMAFNFPVMPRMYLALRRENRMPITEMLNLTADIPEEAQWALFLRNHDELTLEMVTDEERDFMYNEYAADRQFRINVGIRRRLAPLLGGERRRIELMNALLLSLKGSPVIYYGDEIGMGDNTFLGDRNGVRTPMQWSADRNAGFSKAPFHQLFLPTINEGRYSYQFVNVEEGQSNPHSLYNFMRRIIAVRNRHGATFGRGSMTILDLDNARVLAYLRHYQDETILVVANLSRFAQAVQLPLEAFAGQYPVELFSQSPFPQIEAGGYQLSLAPHGFFWFSLEQEPEAVEATPYREPVEAPDTGVRRTLPTLKLDGGIETVLVDTLVQGGARKALEQALPDYLETQRWFGAKERPIRSVKLEDAVRLQSRPFPAYLALLNVAFEEGTERYFLPLATADQESAELIFAERPKAPVAWTEGESERRLLFDATASPDFWQALYRATRNGWKGRSLKGLYSAEAQPGAELPDAPEAQVLGVEQSNSSAIFKPSAFGKLYRKLEAGPSPEAELLDYLTRAEFPFVPQIKGRLGFKRGGLELTLGIFQDYLEADGDVWSYALRKFGLYLDRVGTVAPPQDRFPERFDQEPPVWIEDNAGEVLQMARLIGVRTAEMHRVLGEADAPALRPEPTGPQELGAFVERVKTEAARTLELLEAKEIAIGETLLDRGLGFLDNLAGLEPDWHKIRIHGDYHLGQIIDADGDYYILDFEGEPIRSLEERRSKDQALRDVSGMLRSLEYAALVAWQNHPENGGNAHLEAWSNTLMRWSEAVFLEAYFSTAGPEAAFLPRDTRTRDLLLWAFQLDKVLYEIRYELGHRPDWVALPLQGLDKLLKEIDS